MSHLYNEIHEQPEVIARLISEESDSINRIANELRSRSIRYILIAARGTSDNAATYHDHIYFGHFPYRAETEGSVGP